MLQRRTNGKLDFMKRWRQYIEGFGNMSDEFWIGEPGDFLGFLQKMKHAHTSLFDLLCLSPSGLDKIYELTNTPTQYELRFDLGLGAERAYAVYDNFKIAPVKQKFKLTIGKYRGTAGGLYQTIHSFQCLHLLADTLLKNKLLKVSNRQWWKNRGSPSRLPVHYFYGVLRNKYTPAVGGIFVSETYIPSVQTVSVQRRWYVKKAGL